MAALLPLVLVACGGSGSGESEEEREREETEAKAAGGRDCTGLLQAADPAARPPDLPALPGATYYEMASQGATRVYFASVAGDDVVKVRDEVTDQLKGAGYEIESEDEEENAEAEVEFAGKHAGSVQVIQLCRETLRVRYRLSE